MMRLMSKELAESLEKYPLYSQDDDYLFFGLVVGTDTSAEMGYFSLSQLMDLNVCGLKVERDMYFKPKKLGEICNKSVKEYIDHYFKED